MAEPCSTCGEVKRCNRCRAALHHVHFTTGEPPEWWHSSPARVEELLSLEAGCDCGARSDKKQFSEGK